MTEAETLRRRRELLVLSADVQRATVVARLDQLAVSPMQLLYGFAANATRVFAARRLAFAVLALAGRLFRRRQPGRS